MFWKIFYNIILYPIIFFALLIMSFFNKKIKEGFLGRLKSIKELKTFISIHKLHKKIKPDLVFNFTLKPNIYSNLSAAILNIKTISMITGLGHIFIKANIIYKTIIILLLRLSLKKGIHIELLPAQGLRPYEHDLVTKV